MKEAFYRFARRPIVPIVTVAILVAGCVALTVWAAPDIDDPWHYLYRNAYLFLGGFSIGFMVSTAASAWWFRRHFSRRITRLEDEASDILQAITKSGEFECPECGASEWEPGPMGGLSMNVTCRGCGHRFNILAVPGHVHIINDLGKGTIH